MKFVQTVLLQFFVIINNHIGNSANACLQTGAVPKTSDDPRILAPWVASIFKRNANGDWIFHCGATVTGSSVVITAASCVTTMKGDGVYTQFHMRYTDLRVVAGLKTNNYRKGRDENTQELEVEMIREHKPPASITPSGYVQTYSRPANLAGILLKAQFNFTSYIQSVCLVEVPNTIEETITLRAGETGLLAGFNVNQNLPKTVELQRFNMTIRDTLQCVRSYQSQPFNVACGSVSGSHQNVLPCFLEGAGLIVSTDGTNTGVGSLYLMGIYTSNSATKEYGYPYPTNHINSTTHCTNSDLAFFTKHGEYYRWAISHVYCGPGLLQCQSDNCRPIKELCDGIAQCADKTDESPEVCQNQKDCTKEEFRCRYGACIDNLKVCDGNMDCADNSDEDDLQLCREADARRNVTCPPISSRKGVESKCYLSKYLGGSEIDCKEPVPVGTEAAQFCGRYYTLVQGSGSSTCQRNGSWSDTTFTSCRPSCGISEAPKTRFIVGGENVTNHGEWPWHTAIYRIVRGVETYICGGTLISSRVVLTAAHCVTHGSTGEALLPSDHRIVLGKLSSPYMNKEQENSQEIPIENFEVHEYYNTKSLDSDIAMIVLKYPVEITDTVRPVCLTADLSIITEQFLNANPDNGTHYGTTVGFGLDETKRVSISLKKLKMPVIPKDLCEESLKPYLRKGEGLRYSWICGGYTNGSSICLGDSGGGFVFPTDAYSGRKFYVQGVVSYGFKPEDSQVDPCNKNTYKVFTQVSPYLPWIQKVTNRTEPNYTQ